MTSKSSTPTFKDAVGRYKASAADYEKPDKTHSKHERGAWLLLDKAGRLVAIVQDAGDVLHGPVLLAWSRQLAMGQAPIQQQPVIDGYHNRK